MKPSLRLTHSALLLLFCCYGALAQVPADSVAEASTAEVAAQAVPGGILVLPLPPAAASATFQQRPVLILAGNAIVGIPLSAPPGQHTLNVLDKHGKHSSHAFAIAAKQYPEQRLTIANPRMVNPIEQDLERIRAESARMRSAYMNFIQQDTTGIRPFIKPVSGVTSSPFGHRRILNDQPRSPHSGLDIAASTGTPVAAPAPGTVTITGEFYFNGNTVFLDHGQGLITMYCHLSEIKVTEGIQIERGEILGLVGATGRVTGPHLHWSVSLNGHRVDPELAIAVLSDAPAPD
jgi:murein DD-endopeptidase MepM/ murein hydrolase activator NlpD